MGAPPEWAVILMMAEQWGAPPWVIERDMPLVWRYRWQVLQSLRAEAQEAEAKRARRQAAAERRGSRVITPLP